MPIAFFHNSLGELLGGLDFHENMPYAIPGKLFAIPFTTGQTATVTSDGFQMCQRTFKSKVVPHIPPSDSPDIVAKAVLFTATGATAPYCTKVSVSGVTKPLATTAVHALGVQIHCNDPFDMPTGVGLQTSSTVRTNMTALDYDASSLLYGWSAFVGWAKGEALEKAVGEKDADDTKPFSSLYEFIIDNMIKEDAPDLIPKEIDILLDPIKALDDAVQDLIVENVQSF